MHGFSGGATALFLATVAAVYVWFVLAVGKAAGGDSARRRRWAAWAAAGGLAWLALTGGAALSGMLHAERLPPPVLPLFALSTAVTLALAFSPLGARLASALSPAWLVGYQAFRIPVEWFLFLGYEAGRVPVQMTFEGRNWDALTGITALGLAWLLARGRGGPRLLLAWNVLGLALLANVVTVAVLSMPTPFQVFTAAPADVFVRDVPFVWLPTVLVQAALLGHLLVFRALWRRRGAAHPSQAVRAAGLAQGTGLRFK